MILNKLAIKVLMAFSLFILAGCPLAISSCAKNNDLKNPSETPGSTPSDGPESGSIISNPMYRVVLPEGVPEQIKEYTGFLVSFNKDNHTPNYVSWELLDKEVSDLVSRSNNFWKDYDLLGCPDENAYKYSGYDRGHMCPAADQKWSEQAMNDSFVMSNMCPQKNDLNAKAWETLENKERQWAQRDGAIWIVAGPIYKDDDTERIGNYKVRVPSAFFKAFLAKDIDEPRAIAFVYPNELCPGNMKDYSMSIDELEALLGYDLFSALPDDIENKVEASCSFTEWNRSK